MKRIKSLSMTLLILVLGFNTLFQTSSAVTTPTSSDESSKPYTRLDGDKAKTLIVEAKKSTHYKKAKKIANSKGFKLNGKEIAVHLNEEDADAVYFYLNKKGEKVKDSEAVTSYISIDVSEKNYKSLIQIHGFDKNGVLHSKIYENNKLINESKINKEGLYLKGSYSISDGKKHDLTDFNDKIKNENLNTDEGDMHAQFDWDGFWNCVKEISGPNKSLPLRTMVMGACYYICLTGPVGCITCTAINAGITAGIAGYCVKEYW